MPHPMDRFFAPPEGRLFACFPGAEDRPGQRQMAEVIAGAIAEGTAQSRAWRDAGGDAESKPPAVIQAIEAGTGTGKSLGYLIPALASGRSPVIVATRTKNLQRQLLEDDLPRAVGILGRPVKAVLAKGRSNYLCLTAWEEAQAHPPSEVSKFDYGLWMALPQWADRTATGDREELGPFGEGESPLWDRLNARAERCTGRQCPRYADCHLVKLRQQVAEADLVIVNHALLLADRKLRESAFGQVLPDAPVLILDEAHDLEEQLTEGFAESWSSRAMRLLFSDLEATLGADDSGELEARLPSWEEAWDRLFALMPADMGTYPLHPDKLPLSDLADAVGAWVEAGRGVMGTLKTCASNAKEGDLSFSKLAERCGQAFARMEQIFAQPEGWVSTITRESAGVVHFKSNPIDVRAFFHQHLRMGFESVVMTSATLRDGKGFNGLGLRLGLSHDEVARGLAVDSPFDFETQGLLFVPPGQPERRASAGGVGDPGWIEASLDAMTRLIQASRGRALLLFTSRKMLHAFRPRLESALPQVTFFVQGESLTRTQMLTRFRTTPESAILGLASFWQGVDLPGDALRLVIVTALPFAPPDDPVLAARVREADAKQEGLGFRGIQLPQMTLKLKQGLGRLIRTRSDKGVVTLLDPRILLPREDPNGKRYAAQVRASLPPFPLVREWSRVEGFLREL
ncbi:MAG: ATP-dependent DNA helicase [Acidobacteria bacterium]|nr:ATP-dependent DNA helicase [Acidobacteriota bacterium]